MVSYITRSSVECAGCIEIRQGWESKRHGERPAAAGSGEAPGGSETLRGTSQQELWPFLFLFFTQLYAVLASGGGSIVWNQTVNRPS